MCTAISYKSKSHHFGRTLDLECSFFEKVIITPRKYNMHFRNISDINRHYAIIGIGIIEDEYPLYYDAVNEMGLGIAGLNFPGYAVYNQVNLNLKNIASFEFIPYILSLCKNVDEAIECFKKINITTANFSNKFTNSPLHWFIADKTKAITVEPLDCGLKIHDNPVGVLTNNPTFDYQMFSLNNFSNLSPYSPSNKFSDSIKLTKYSRGLGALGLPGDLSSNSRFIRACYTKLNSISPDIANGDLTQFFHVMETVSQTLGTVRLENNKLEQTVYTSCCDTEKLIYFYTTYNNRQINAVKMLNEDLESKKLISYSINNCQKINYIN